MPVDSLIFTSPNRGVENQRDSSKLRGKHVVGPFFVKDNIDYRSPREEDKRIT